MIASQWIVVAGNAVAASVLLFASFTKLVSPDALGRSLLRLTNRQTLSSVEVVRTIGVGEAVIATALLIEPARLTASLLLGLLGLSFMALGITGRIRKVDEPCGCFGAASQQPLGNQNIVLGVLIAAIGAINLQHAGQLSDSARATAPILTAGLLCLICLATSRSSMRPRQPLELS